MQTYFIQAIHGENFEDLYIRARNYEEALRKAKKETTIRSRWTRFVA